MSLHSHRLNEAAAIATQTDSAANQFGALAYRAQKTREGHSRCLVSVCRSFTSDLWIGERP
jgi:hypothetical protein